MSMRRPTHPGEKILLKTRPQFTSTLESAFFRLIILLLLLYFFTAIIGLFAAIQSRIDYLTTVPFVQYSTYVLLIIIAVLFFWILWNFLSWRSTWYTVTTQRVQIKSGVLSTKSVYIHFNKMQDIEVTQSLVQRISSSGDIEIFGGRDKTNLILEDIPKPNQVEDLINQRIEVLSREPESRASKRNERYGDERF
ncbi:MAG: PH domain-containing protein [Methanobacterium sp. ERen5]|nr:MAG: PH domain-containing protein [Methanobacterium sp. ERen5]